MRYRKLAQQPGTNVFNYQGGDYTFGNGAADFWINVPDAPAQAALTRMYLFLGDWFLDTSDGTPWNTQVLGHYTRNTRDPAIQSRILGTQGVSAILSYSSNVVRDTRAFTVNCEIDTIYGGVTIPVPAIVTTAVPISVRSPNPDSATYAILLAAPPVSTPPSTMLPATVGNPNSTIYTVLLPA